MRFSIVAVLASMPLLAIAKDCAVYYTWSSDIEQNPARDQKATIMCDDIGGTVNPTEIALKDDGGDVNRCAICRDARGSTDDYDRTIMQDGEGISYSVRCGYFAKGSCHA
ncbi:hypothetical protein B0T10DRAFT_466610 [Thelonectria olida]|uniref:Uncharacterized protein n=1 Tax=Thelonectria olida TaxID=1576542 RepID=A0A9P8VSP6_9HYPO|nr:hypothetical protein B0T10DRAFT_466610 [Thelonectria olida]